MVFKMVITKEPIQLSEFEGKNVLVITGAGMSVAAGIPPYWGDDGVYTELQAKYGLPIEVVLSKENFDVNPAQVWEYIGESMSKFSSVAPTDGYRAITEIEKVAKHFDLITQNVDGLHKRAGTESVQEIHGHVESASCTNCSAQDYDYREQLLSKDVPTCVRCGNILRPNVVLFNMFPNFNPLEANYRAEQADVVLVIGTQSYFQYITDMFNVAANSGSRIIFVDKADPEELLANPLINSSVVDVAECFVGEAEAFLSAI